MHERYFACHPEEDPPVKAQWIRLLDVVLIGPLMVAGGAALSRGGAPWWGAGLAALGLGTIAFNGVNYVRVRERQIALSRGMRYWQPAPYFAPIAPGSDSV